MMTALFALAGVWLAFLAAEAALLSRARKKVKHIVHVNGIRGKSSVSRLIDAALRAGGYRVLTKTTGTDPVIIGTDGKERPVKRFGRANIREQARTLLLAAKENADVLIIECMAVQPELQHVCQHSILKADVSVLTNVRRDHADVMGDTLEEIASSLSNTVPAGGAFFTAEHEHTGPLKEKCARLHAAYHEISPDGGEPGADFPENEALAIAVAEHLGVDGEKAAEGIRTLYLKDPYVLSVHEWNGAVFVNGFSVNDPSSLLIVWEHVKNRYGLGDAPPVLFINNRPDRGSRASDMLTVAKALAPERIYLLGAYQGYTRQKLKRILPGARVTGLGRAEDITEEMLREGGTWYAVGNIANEGRRVMERVRKEGREYVR